MRSRRTETPGTRRAGVFGAVLVGAAALLSARSAVADEPLPPPPPPPPPPYGEPAPAPRTAPAPYEGEPLGKPAPLGHRGFQMAIRTGVAFPMGMAYSRSAPTPSAATASMGDVTGAQIPIILDIGGKPERHVFVGGYVGFGFGGTAGALGAACNSCGVASRVLGAEVFYSILPDDWVNPWVGYGLGFSWLSAGDGVPELDLHGFDLARLTFGIDFRLSRTIGLGPYVDYDVGIYSYANGDIHGRAVHEWLVVGPRFVLLP
jgi:hypothetical protein